MLILFILGKKKKKINIINNYIIVKQLIYREKKIKIFIYYCLKTKKKVNKYTSL